MDLAPLKNNNDRFASGYESKIFTELKKANVEVEYEPRSFVYSRRTSKVFCRDCGSKRVAKSASYTPDFRIGRSIYLESKGYFKPSNRGRMEDFIKDRPDVDLRFIFGSDNWLTHRKLKRYSDWAKAHKVKYAIDNIPKEWLEEAKSQLDPNWRGSLPEDANTAGGIHLQELPKLVRGKRGKVHL